MPPESGRLSNRGVLRIHQTSTPTIEAADVILGRRWAIPSAFRIFLSAGLFSMTLEVTGVAEAAPPATPAAPTAQMKIEQNWGVHHLLFSPDSRYLAIFGEGGSVTMWDWSSRIGGAAIKLDSGTPFTVGQFVFSPNGQYAASNAGDGIVLWQLDQSTTASKLDSLWGASGFSFSPDSKCWI